MNLNELKIRIADVLGVSDTEKELAFEIFLQKAFFVLDFEETLKVPNVGFFQFKTKPFLIGDSIIPQDDEGFNNSLVFAPTKQDLTDDAQNFLTLDIAHQKKDLFELDENVFSIGVGKPILPISSEKNSGDAETSYILLKKSIEERVSEVISESEHLQNFDIWDDHLSMLDNNWESPSYRNSSTIHKLTDDIEYTEEEIKPTIPEEEDYHINGPAENDHFKELDDSLEESDDSVLDLDDFLKEPDDFSKESDDYLKEPNDFSKEPDDYLKEPNDSLMDSSNLIDEPDDISDEIIDSPDKSELNTDDIDDELDILDDYDDSLEADIEANFHDKEVFEDKPEIETPPLDILEDEKISRKTKFWGIEDFKSSDEKKISDIIVPEKEDDEEETNVDWDWGDDLMGDNEDSGIDVDSFEHEDNAEPDLEEVRDEETSTNLFIQLEKSLTREEDDEEEDDMVEFSEEKETVIESGRDSEDENLLQESQLLDEDKEEDSVKAKYVRNFLILFGTFAAVIVLVLVFLSPSDEGPIETMKENQATDIVTREPVMSETDNTLDNELVQPEDPLENPIEERTRQMQTSVKENTVSPPQIKTPVKTNVNQTELYRNIPNERSVRELIFTDGSKYFVQVSSWPTKIKAEIETRRLRGLGFDAFIVAAYIEKFRSTWYRVKIGDFNSTSEAEAFLLNTKF